MHASLHGKSNVSGLAQHLSNHSSAKAHLLLKDVHLKLHGVPFIQEPGVKTRGATSGQRDSSQYGLGVTACE